MSPLGPRSTLFGVYRRSSKADVAERERGAALALANTTDGSLFRLLYPIDWPTAKPHSTLPAARPQPVTGEVGGVQVDV